MSIKLTPNEQKIIDYLEKNGKSDTTPVADGTGINRKSIGRYAQSLARKGLITREYRMEGSVRYWELEIAESKPEPIPKAVEILKGGTITPIMYDLSVGRLKREKILGDKDMDKKEIINWFKDFISKNQKQFTLDWLRGQKLSFEAVNEVRKK